MTTKEEILKEFEDFYWECGKYKDRHLGITEYKKWLSTSIDKILEEIVPESKQPIYPEQGIISNNYHECGKNIGYNDCREDIIKKINSLRTE